MLAYLLRNNKTFLLQPPIKYTFQRTKSAFDTRVSNRFLLRSRVPEEENFHNKNRIRNGESAPPTSQGKWVSAPNHFMKQFTCTISDPLGIHARPAGLLAKLAKSYGDTNITITKDDKTVKLSQLMMLMGLGMKQGTSITIQLDGPSEDEAAEKIQTFLQENL